MLTKSNNTDIEDIEKILGDIKRPTMIAAILYNPTKKDWAINTLRDIAISSQKGFEFWGQVSCRPLTNGIYNERTLYVRRSIVLETVYERKR